MQAQVQEQGQAPQASPLTLAARLTSHRITQWELATILATWEAMLPTILLELTMQDSMVEMLLTTLQEPTMQDSMVGMPLLSAPTLSMRVRLFPKPPLLKNFPYDLCIRVWDTSAVILQPKNVLLSVCLSQSSFSPTERSRTANTTRPCYIGYFHILLKYVNPLLVSEVCLCCQRLLINRREIVCRQDCFFERPQTMFCNLMI